jgi:hypothetical protein
MTASTTPENYTTLTDVTLANAIEEHYVLIVDDAVGSPDGVTTVPKDQWRAAFEVEDTSRRSPDALRMAFNRAFKATIEAGQVNDRNDHFWPSERSEQAPNGDQALVQLLFVSNKQKIKTNKYLI